MKLKAWHILLIVLVFGGVLLAASHAGKQWRMMQAPDMLRVSNRGDLYVLARDRIFVYNNTGTYQKMIELSRWGITQSTGGFGIFNNGDLLLLAGSHDQGFLLELLTYLRMEKLVAHEENGGRRLVRCSAETGQCHPLPAFTRTFSNTFRVLIDSDDSIFLADTMRDSITWLDAEGHVLAEVSTGFRFPNQIALEKSDAGKNLLVANTNHNEITVMPLRLATMGVGGVFAPDSEWQHLAVDGAVPARTGHIWPLDIVRVGDARFVLQQGDNMGRGLLVKYDLAGQFIKPFTMPADSDAMAIAWFNQQLLVADDALMTIWLYDITGEMQGEFSSYELKTYLQTLAQEKQYFQKQEKQWWLLFKGLLALGFVVAVIGEKTAGKRNQQVAVEQAQMALLDMQQTGETERPAADDPEIHWLAKDQRRLRGGRMVLGLTILFMLLTNVLWIASRFATDDTALQQPLVSFKLYLLGAVITFMLAMFWITQRLVARMSIGVLREWVILRNMAGKTAVGRGADILLFSSAIAIGGVSVQLGLRRPGELPQRSVFDKNELQQWLAPRLLNAHEQSLLDALGWFFRYQTVQAILLLLALFLFAGTRFL